MKFKSISAIVFLLLSFGFVLVVADDGPKPKAAASIPIPERKLTDIKQKLGAAQSAIDGNTYLEGLIIDKESGCNRQLIKLAESDRAAKVNAYQAAYYALRDELLKDGQKDWQPDYAAGVFQAPTPTPPKP